MGETESRREKAGRERPEKGQDERKAKGKQKAKKERWCIRGEKKGNELTEYLSLGIIYQ
jgi:hypothetical protein